MKRSEDSLRDLWDNIKCNNIHIIGVPEREEREKGPEKIFEDIIVETSRAWERKQPPKSRKQRESHTGKTQGENTETHSNQICQN